MGWGVSSTRAEESNAACLDTVYMYTVEREYCLLFCNISAPFQAPIVDVRMHLQTDAYRQATHFLKIQDCMVINCVECSMGPFFIAAAAHGHVIEWQVFIRRDNP